MADQSEQNVSPSNADTSISSNLPPPPPSNATVNQLTGKFWSYVNSKITSSWFNYADITPEHALHLHDVFRWFMSLHYKFEGIIMEYQGLC